MVLLSGCNNQEAISPEKIEITATDEKAPSKPLVKKEDTKQLETTKEVESSQLISRNDPEFHTIGGDENGPYSTDEYKKQLGTLLDEGKLILLKTIDYKSVELGNSGEMDILQLKDAILGIQYNDECSCYYELYETLAEAEDANKVLVKDDAFSSTEATELIEKFYEHIGNHNYSEAYELIGTPWKNELSYESFSSGYANTIETEFRVISVDENSDTQMTVHGGLRSVDKSDTSMINNEFDVEYFVEKQNNQLIISKGKGTLIKAIESPLNEDSWSFERWDDASLEEKVTKIARTWEQQGLNPRGNGVLVAVAMFIDDQREQLLTTGSTLEELINQSYDSPELQQYDPQEKCENELPDDWGC